MVIFCLYLYLNAICTGVVKWECSDFCKKTIAKSHFTPFFCRDIFEVEWNGMTEFWRAKTLPHLYLHASDKILVARTISP